MFTGIVECTVEVEEILPVEGGARLTFSAPFEGVSLGDSIAVNGCCLTVSEREGNRFSFDILAQTLRITSLGDLRPGSRVNLERAMSLGDRLGGHIVQGHVDDRGVIAALEPVGQDHRLEVEIPERLLRYCIDKGSLTIDGISLTIARLGEKTAEFWITPHTFAETHLSAARIGQKVNLEVDVVAKYVERLLAYRSDA